MPLHVITGALGYSGQAIVRKLLDQPDSDRLVLRTLTNSPGRPNPFGCRLQIHPLNFADHAQLVCSLSGADVLYNTYWVRYNHARFTFQEAVENSIRLFRAAADAGVGRIVHVSILKPELGKGLAYYEGKLKLEQNLRTLGIPHAILRPGVLFGNSDILINNIAWVLRHLPIFGVFGDGRYKLQPMHVDDFADLIVRAAHESRNQILDAVGPEIFEFRELVETLCGILKRRCLIVNVPPGLGYAVSRILNPLVGDVIITRQEIAGLMRGLLFSDAPPIGTTRLTDWAKTYAGVIGTRYASEIARRVRRDVAYEQL